MSIPLKRAKVCVVGEQSVGKTCIINRTIKNTFSQDLRPTVADVYKYPYKKNGNNIEFEIWDTAGQETYRSLVPMYWQKANVIIVVYDITSSNSYDALEEWTRFIPETIFNSAVVLLVGNKLDLKNARVIEYSKADDFSSLYNFTKYFEVSALSGEGINDVWDFIAETPEVQDISIDNDDIPDPSNPSNPPNPPNPPNPESNGIISTITGYLYSAYEYVKSFF